MCCMFVMSDDAMFSRCFQSFLQSSGSRFPKDAVTYWARKAVIDTMTCLQ